MRPTCERVREIVGLINYVSICYINYSMRPTCEMVKKIVGCICVSELSH